MDSARCYACQNYYGKKIKTILKIQIAAGKFSPAPPVGPTLAQQA